MAPSSRTPEGEPNRCCVCGNRMKITPSVTRDAPCPRCGTLNWFENQITAKQKYQFTVKDFRIFRECVKLVPSHLTFRQLLRRTEQKLFDAGKLPDQFESTGKLIQIRRRLAEAFENERWKEVDREAENGLEVVPYDFDLNLKVGQANEALGNQEIAYLGYFEACKRDPSRTDLFNKCKEYIETRRDS